ncbi:MAG TPA: protein-glutamate O-methyltransferase CheR [Bacillota bacterium]|nr:protein-glutamate O-methyltransferase CheR [Bacillota bacterium]HOK68647.1 protein-glutamate O-methyltransferase CheR [Bacillota bacterium]HPP84759.1 protein-glutamate O-methyltransferase CheR [Bacillota bacterium]
MIEITDKEFEQLVSFIKKNYGIHIKKEKRAMLTGRLSSTLIQHGYKSFSEFYEKLISDDSKEAITTLVNRITTNHTYFMREKDHFEYFQKTVLPYLEQTIKNKDLRIWCAACSTGEESYTLAMIIDEYFGERKSAWDTRLLATDISERVLNIAKQGVYDKENVSVLPANWRMAYFKPYDKDRFVVADRIKNDVIYRKFNLMEKVFPFKKKFHVIFCRNVMIYFDNETKEELIRKFYDILEDGGYLFIGHSESILRSETNFKYVKPAIYRKM